MEISRRLPDADFGSLMTYRHMLKFSTSLRRGFLLEGPCKKLNFI